MWGEGGVALIDLHSRALPASVGESCRHHHPRLSTLTTPWASRRPVELGFVPEWCDLVAMGCTLLGVQVPQTIRNLAVSLYLLSAMTPSSPSIRPSRENHLQLHLGLPVLANIWGHWHMFPAAFAVMVRWRGRAAQDAHVQVPGVKSDANIPAWTRGSFLLPLPLLAKFAQFRLATNEM